MTTENQVQLPKYVTRAIMSETARTEPYNALSVNEWREVAEHIYADEIVPNPDTGRTFLRRGTLSDSGRGRKATLDTILGSAVQEHRGVAMLVPYRYRVAEMFVKLYPSMPGIDPAFHGYDRKTA